MIWQQLHNYKNHNSSKTIRMFLKIYLFSNISHTTQVELINSLTKINQQSETNNLKKLISVSYLQACLMNQVHQELELHSFITYYCKIVLIKLIPCSHKLMKHPNKHIGFNLITFNVSLTCIKDIQALLNQEPYLRNMLIILLKHGKSYLNKFLIL